MKTRIFLLILLIVGLISCNEDEVNEVVKNTKPIELKISTKSKKLVTSSSNFGIDLANKIAEFEQEKENWMISPLSVTLALAMTYNGADGETKKAMEETMRLSGLSIEEINANFKDLIDKLLEVDKKVDVSISNSIWYRDGLTVLPDFIDVNKKFYNAEVQKLDFSNPKSKDIINNWVADKTNDKITSIINNISPEAVMYLINAIYFKGLWKYKFNPSNNINQPFTYKDGTSKDIEMMTCKADFKGFNDNDIALLEMPYGQGNWVIDLVKTNNDKSIEEVMTNLTSDRWNSWINNLSEPLSTSVFLPPFKFEYKKELKECLTDLGMGVAFEPYNADFSKINGSKDLFISKVIHKTFIELNEKGTEAAAVTAVEVETTSVGPKLNFFKLDKPFMFVIREVSTNTIAFIGKVGNPKRE